MASGLVETNIKTSDGRVYWVAHNGQVWDLPAKNIPPIIYGVARDGLRLLTDTEGSGIPQDIEVANLGLTAQSVASVARLQQQVKK